MSAPLDDRLTDWLARSPWLTAAELSALCGASARTVRHRLAGLVAAGRARRLAVAPSTWPTEALFALAGPAGPLPAPRRLVRLEHVRALHALLARLAEPAAPPLTARLSDEAGGPPLAGARHPLAGLADGWLVRADPPAGLLLRWDDGERRDATERAWLATLVALAPYAPPVALVCAGDAGPAAWLDRLAGLPRRPPLRLTTAAALARPTPETTVDWLDADGRPAPAPALEPLPAGLLTAPAPAPGRGLAGLAARRLALSAADLATLRLMARYPLLTIADLAWFLGVDRRRAYAHVARLAAGGLAGRGPAGGQPALWATGAGLRLLAAVAGLSPAQHRRLTATAGGAPDRAGGRALARLAAHPRHTRAIVRLRQHLQAAVEQARAGSRDARLLDWQGPATRPVLFPTGEPALTRRWWAAPGRRGKVEPDAIARLQLDGRRLTLLIEWDRGTEGRARLARKLRHYVAWGASPAARDALALVITTTARRETLIHDLANELARRHRRPTPPLWTTTAGQVARAGLFGPIWRTADGAPPRSLGTAAPAAHRPGS
ncbi:MAG: replication-relaxation family protein [Chloroflexi bacterium]|nr:replication-relaxation family protein [Chloroflexota bacterium]